MLLEVLSSISVKFLRSSLFFSLLLTIFNDFSWEGTMDIDTGFGYFNLLKPFQIIMNSLVPGTGTHQKKASFLLIFKKPNFVVNVLEAHKLDYSKLATV